ncbi:MAG: hypothetical protein GXO22_00675 [Aquificae bacterium]|nr:hypothetical protein [Aquificota bacterium]
MSIIFDNLKKVKKKQPSTSVYPIISVKKKKNMGLFVIIAIGTILIVGIAGFFVFLPIEKNQKIISNPTATKPVQKPVPKTKKEENPISYSRTTLPSSEIEPQDYSQQKSAEKSTSKNQLTAGGNSVKPTKESKKVSLDIEREFKSYLIKGDEAYLQGDINKAILMYEKALKIKEDIPTYMTLLSIYASAGNIKKIEQILKYPDLYPWLDEDIVAITIKTLAESNYKGNIKSLEKIALEYDKTGRVHEALGYFYERRKQMALALHHYKEAYKKNPQDPEIAFKFALILQKTGDKTGAKNIYQKILTMDIEPSLEKKIKAILKKMG